jgi:hypothetical protein
MADLFAPLLSDPVLPRGKSIRKLDRSPATPSFLDHDSSLSSFEFKLQEIQFERVKEAIQKSISLRHLDNSFTDLAAAASTKATDLVLHQVEEEAVTPPGLTTCRALPRSHNSMSTLLSCDATGSNPKSGPSLSHRGASTRRVLGRAASVANLNNTTMSCSIPTSLPVIQDPPPREATVGRRITDTSSSRFRGSMRRLGRAMQRKSNSHRILQSHSDRHLTSTNIHCSLPSLTRSSAKREATKRDKPMSNSSREFRTSTGSRDLSQAQSLAASATEFTSSFSSSSCREFRVTAWNLGEDEEEKVPYMPKVGQGISRRDGTPQNRRGSNWGRKSNPLKRSTSKRFPKVTRDCPGKDDNNTPSPHMTRDTLSSPDTAAADTNKSSDNKPKQSSVKLMKMSALSQQSRILAMTASGGGWQSNSNSNKTSPCLTTATATNETAPRGRTIQRAESLRQHPTTNLFQDVSSRSTRTRRQEDQADCVAPSGERVFRRERALTTAAATTRVLHVKRSQKANVKNKSPPQKTGSTGSSNSRHAKPTLSNTTSRDTSPPPKNYSTSSNKGKSASPKTSSTNSSNSKGPPSRTIPTSANKVKSPQPNTTTSKSKNKSPQPKTDSTGRRSGMRKAESQPFVSGTTTAATKPSMRSSNKRQRHLPLVKSVSAGDGLTKAFTVVDNGAASKILPPDLATTAIPLASQPPPRPIIEVMSTPPILYYHGRQNNAKQGSKFGSIPVGGADDDRSESTTTDFSRITLDSSKAVKHGKTNILQQTTVLMDLYSAPRKA